MKPRSGGRALWGWTDPTGCALAAGTVMAAGALALLAPGGRPNAGPPPALRIDPNTTPAMVLPALPHLGPSRAAAIVAARRRTTLRSPDDLDREVRGLGPATLRALRPYLSFRPEPAAGSAELPDLARRPRARGPR